MPIAVPRTNYPSKIRNYTAMVLILLVSGGYYFFMQYQKLSATRLALAQGQEVLSTMQKNLALESNRYNESKKASDEKFLDILNSLKKVYPTHENYTDIPRLFDQFVEKNRTSQNPVEISDIKLGVPRVEASKDYSLLPVTMTISGSQQNFLKFLKMVENSGELSDGSRLMEIRSISINFANTSGAGSESRAPTLNVSVGINAYFQKADTSPTTSGKV